MFIASLPFFKDMTNPFLNKNFISNPIISKHNKSPFLGGKIFHLNLPSLKGFNSKMTNPFLNNFKKPINESIFELFNENYSMRVPFLQKVSLGARSIRMKQDRLLTTPYHPNRKHATRIPNWKN